MDLPFFRSDKEWLELRPKDIDGLGQDDGLDPKQKKLLEVFRIQDLRIESSCRRGITNHNWLVVLTAVVVVGEGKNIITILTTLLSVIFK